MGFKRKGGWESAYEEYCGHKHPATGAYCELVPEHPGKLHGFKPSDPKRLDVKTCSNRVWAEVCCEAVPPKGATLTNGHVVPEGKEEQYFCDLQRDEPHNEHVCHYYRDHKQTVFLKWPVALHVVSPPSEIHEIDTIAPDATWDDEKKLPTWKQLNELDRKRFNPAAKAKE